MQTRIVTPPPPATLACLALLLGLATAAPPVIAQTDSAIQGTVTDSTGAVVPGAEVSITHVATQRVTVVESNEAGFFAASGLLAGVYDVAVRLEGFQTHQTRGLKVDPSSRRGLDVALELGEVTEQVTVEAAAVSVETESGAVGGVITGEHIQELMLNGRNFMGLALLEPGVNNTSSGGRIIGGGSLLGGGLTAETPISMNGLGREFNYFTIDGIYNMNTGNMININITSPLDTISEIRILKNNYSAKHGVTGNGQIMVETKSGGTSYHGSLYEFLRNDALDASNYFAGTDPATGKRRKTPLKQHNFGFSFGGPIKPGSNNLFFFVSEDFRIKHTGKTLRGAVIPQEMRNGDFSNSPTLADGAFNLSDVGRQHLERDFPGVRCILSQTQLNPACFDPNAITLMDTYWPLPNNPSGGFQNYINPGVQIFNQRSDTYRVDYYINNSMRLMSRFSYEDALDESPAADWGPNPAPTLQQTIKTTGYNALIRLTANISPTFLNVFTFAGSHDKPRLNILGADLPAGIDINYAFPDSIAGRAEGPQIPSIFFAQGWAGIHNGGFPEQASDGAITMMDDITKVKGNHVLQAGAVYIWGVKRQNAFAATNGQFRFNGIHTGDPVGDYLLGLNTNFRQQDSVPRYNSHWDQFEMYFQDDWKVNPRLTLNLGLRYMYATPDITEEPWFSDFDASTFDINRAPLLNPGSGAFRAGTDGVPIARDGGVYDPLNGIVLPGVDGVPLTIYRGDKGNFAPRVGFAWDVLGTGRMAIRGGYGVGYSVFRYGVTNSYTQPPWVQTVSLNNGTLSDPLVGAAGAVTPAGLRAHGPPNGIKRNARVHTWSFTVEREMIRDGIFSIAYVGTYGQNMPGQNDINFPLPANGPSINDPGCLQAGQSAAAQFDFDPCINAGLVVSNFTRPFPGWAGIVSRNGASDYYGVHRYNSLQSGFKYRAGRDVTLNIAYTWGKVLTDVGNRGTDGRQSGSGAQNHRNRAAEYGPPGQDRTHIFTSGYIWHLPFLKNSQGFVRNAFGNWTFSGITVIQSGFALAPGMSLGTRGLASRPDCIGGNPNSGPKTVEQWFDTSVFAAPAYGSFGNCGTGIIRSPGEVNFNWALFKNFQPSEGVRIQFRTEFFNVFNHPNFGNIQTAFGAGNFGQVTTALEERQIEFGLRIDF